MSGNGYGTHRSSRAEDMAAYDASPPLLRRIVAYSVAKWASEPLLDYWRSARRAGQSDAQIARFVARTHREGEQDDTLAFYGPTHPEAPRLAFRTEDHA